MNTLGITQSVCPTCRQLVPAKVVTDGYDVYFQKFCSEHGCAHHLVYRGLEDYLKAQRFVKPAWLPREWAGTSTASCPQGCGFCARHEQHLCMPIVEITSRCDLACPVCLVNAGGSNDMNLDQFRDLLDALVRAEGQIDVLNLSGGEPLIHPQLLAFVDEALARQEIVRVSISTNGLALLDNPSLLGDLYARNVVISLQFDGFDDRAYTMLRGRPLLKIKQAILERLAGQGISTSLTMTAAGGVNDEQFPAMLDYLFSQPHIVSMMIQPLAFAGRGTGLDGRVTRLTIPDIVQRLAESDSRVRADDFAPLPCSHPICFSLAYYLLLEGGKTVSMNRLVDASRMMDTLANRTIFGLDAQEQEHLKDMIYELWSGPAGQVPDSDSVMATLRNILDQVSRSCFDPRKAFTIAERRVKSIFIHAFQDDQTFDLSRVRRCCNAYAQPDGRLIPVCVHNIWGRQS